MAEPKVDYVLDIRAKLSECPSGASARKSLGRLASLSAPSPSARRRGAVLVALISGIYRRGLASGKRQMIAHPEAHLHDNRMNDGRTDPAGRFWAGSMRDSRMAALGARSIASISTSIVSLALTARFRRHDGRRLANCATPSLLLSPLHIALDEGAALELDEGSSALRLSPRLNIPAGRIFRVVFRLVGDVARMGIAHQRRLFAETP